MNIRLLIFFCGIITIPVLGQEFQEISTGPGYSLQSFINLEEGTASTLANDSWDIAFSVANQDAGVFINESAGTVMGVPERSISLYDARSDDFSEVPDTSIFLQFPLFNAEGSWESGAFNAVADVSNPFDFGWGAYDATSHQILGSRVFAIALRDGIFRKMQIQSLIGGVYTFRIANLDGSEEQIKSVPKSDGAGNVLVYFSFDADTIVQVEPESGFDLWYGRYYTPLDAGDGDTLDYAVTGILSGPGVEIAQADGVDPLTVDLESFQDSFSTYLDVIGHDWKVFDLSSFQYSVPEDRVYFVKTAGGHLWKLVFIDFEGSSTGNAVFEKTDLGLLSPVLDLSSPLSHFEIYPNPAIAEVHIVLSTREEIDLDAEVVLTGLKGEVLRTKHVQLFGGLNSLNFDATDLHPGIYLISIRVNQQVISKVLNVQH